MKKIDSIIKKKSYYNLYKSTYVCHIIKEIIDKELGTKVEVEKFKNMAAIVKMKNPCLVTEAKMRKEKIIKKVNKKINEEVLRNIRFI